MHYVDLFTEHDGLVSHKWEHYLFIYQELLHKYQQNNKPVNLLEIGVQNGGSLEIWKKFLPKDSKIYGIDINPKCNELNFSDNIFFTLGNAADEKFWVNNLTDINFDIIIDDGSHLCDEVIKTFEMLFIKRLNMGGIFIVEDLHASYWRDFKGGLRYKNSSVEYFKNIVDSVNYNYIYDFKLEERKNIFTKSKKLSNHEKEKLNILNKHIKKVSFYDSVCAIEKYNILLEHKFKSFLTGSDANVVVNENFENVKINYDKDKIVLLKKIFE